MQGYTYSTLWKAQLPEAGAYFASLGLRLIGRGEWRSALCPFHDDRRPSLRVNIRTGAFRCFSCGAKGGDIVAFHRLKYGLGFRAALRDLGVRE